MMERIRMNGKCRTLFGFGDGVTQEEIKRAFDELIQRLRMDSEIQLVIHELDEAKRVLRETIQGVREGRLPEEDIERAEGEVIVQKSFNEYGLQEKIAFYTEQIAKEMRKDRDSLFKDDPELKKGLKDNVPGFDIFVNQLKDGGKVCLATTRRVVCFSLSKKSREI